MSDQLDRSLNSLSRSTPLLVNPGSSRRFDDLDFYVYRGEAFGKYSVICRFFYLLRSLFLSFQSSYFILFLGS